ncbi:MAG: hypothetical protein PW789_12890 [Edaphobacter sp.]|uniref:hypothetical protein n=1 Tax=Edaphobacter sp. TaxID=1934404 RepID=UPI00238C03A0|nr:hypothetical protein [Edaphobacter sp.]MDE1177480.1 hypothetical protein [Edaphobacter sp.]
MKRLSTASIGLTVAGAVLWLTQAGAQTVGNWSTNRNDAGRAGVQKAETTITKESLAKDFKFLWKLKLGKETGALRSYSEPLLIFRLINSKGFKDFVIWSDTQTVYAVDSELGSMLWEKHYDAAPAACAASSVAMSMEPPLVINFGARRVPGQRPPTQQGPLAVNERRVGVAAGGGGFGLKGIYVLTADGYLHEQVITTGVDFAPPVKFVPGAVGVTKGLGLGGKVMYTTTAAPCAGAKNALYAMDMTSASYPVSTYDAKGVALLTTMGPTLGDGLAYVVTGKGVSDETAGVHANSVIALTPDAKVKAWYDAGGALRSVTPVAFAYQGKKLLAAPGKGGSLVLLDAEMPGGDDHHTVLAETTAIGGAVGASDALSVWQDASSGTTWLFASVHGAVGAATKFSTSYGAATHGSIVAFKIEESGGKLSLTPQWMTKDMVNPAPPVIANGMVIALAQGSPAMPAKLLVLDAANGKELYTSGKTIPTYAQGAGLSVGDGHVFFVTHEHTLYSFGIGIEH